LCKLLQLTSDEAVDVLDEYTRFKTTKTESPALRDFTANVKVYPIASAACERGFSFMNSQHSTERNRLQVATVSALLMISINGPLLYFWDPARYVVSWLKKPGNKSALAKCAGGKKGELPQLKPHEKLFVKMVQ